MRRLLKLTTAAAVTAAAAGFVRRWLKAGGGSLGGESIPAPASASNSDHPTRQELYRQAQEIGIEGRSKMNKRQLEEAVETAKTGGRS